MIESGMVEDTTIPDSINKVKFRKCPVDKDLRLSRKDCPGQKKPNVANRRLVSLLDWARTVDLRYCDVVAGEGES